MSKKGFVSLILGFAMFVFYGRPKETVQPDDPLLRGAFSLLFPRLETVLLPRDGQSFWAFIVLHSGIPATRFQTDSSGLAWFQHSGSLRVRPKCMDAS